LPVDLLPSSKVRAVVTDFRERLWTWVGLRLLVVSSHQVIDELLGPSQPLLHIIDSVDQLLNGTKQIQIGFGHLTRRVELTLTLRLNHQRQRMSLLSIRNVVRVDLSFSSSPVNLRRWNVLLIGLALLLAVELRRVDGLDNPRFSSTKWDVPKKRMSHTLSSIAR
jgi:hypothetical protein